MELSPRLKDLRPVARSRRRRTTLRVSTTQGPDETSIVVTRDAAALVVVDMQNYFLSPRCREHPLGLAAVEQTLRVIEKCRTAGIQVRL